MAADQQASTPPAASATRRPWLSPLARRLLRIGVTLAILGVCAYAATRLDWRGAARAAADAHWGWLAVACAINFPFILLQSWRWQLLLRPAGGAPLWSLFRYLLASRAASNLLPARAGELLRIYFPRARDGLPVATLTSILVVERFFDAAGLAAVSTPLLVLFDAPPWVRTAVLILLGGAVVGLGATAVLALRGSRERESILDRIALSAEVMRRPRLALVILLITVGCWSTEVVMVLASLGAARLPMRPGLATMVLLAVNMGQVLQVTPGNVGVLEAACMAALAAAGVSGPRALAMAVLYHMVLLVPVTLAGLEGLRFVGEARRASAAPEQGSS